jgi:hypothetical protein
MSGGFIVPITNNNNKIIGWTRGDYIVANAVYYKESGMDLRFLKIIDNKTIVEISQEEKDAILAQDEADKLTRETAEQERIIAEQERNIAEQEALDNVPFEVSKYKLCIYFYGIGKLNDLMEYINADSSRVFLWNASMVLDSDNAMVLEAFNNISNLLPEGVTAIDILRQCRV